MDLGVQMIMLFSFPLKHMQHSKLTLPVIHLQTFLLLTAVYIVDCWLPTGLDVNKCGAHYSKVSVTTESKKILLAFPHQRLTDTAPFVCLVPDNFKCRWWVSADFQLFFFFSASTQMLFQLLEPEMLNTHNKQRQKKSLIIRKDKKKWKCKVFWTMTNKQEKSRKSHVLIIIIIFKKNKLTAAILFAWPVVQ